MHAALWATKKKYNISANLIRVIKNLYDKATSTVLFTSSTGDWFLYACESWTLTAELQRRIQAMEMRCCRKILSISYKDHVTNEEVRAKIQQAIGPHENLLTIVKGHKLQCYGHVSRSSGLAKTILQGTVKEEDKADSRRGGKTTSGNGRAWSLPSPRGQWKTGKNGGNWF